MSAFDSRIKLNYTFHFRILTKVEMPDIGFNEERQTKFRSEVDKGLQPILINALTGKLLDSINVALKSGDVRLPSA